ncbi:MAG: fasciclin domain-containing protein [Bacteroidaceae bacterium]|nr:fasciclin domain-containing protein [Bacteroidaceae bacterium]
MNKTFGKNLKVWALAALTVLSGVSFVSCNDEIDEKNRFTFKGELISTYLQNNPDKFSNFIYILEKAKIGKDQATSGSVMKMLSTYGAYTCFAPTNEAVDSFLIREFTKYEKSLVEHEADKNIPIYNTGIKSPYLEDLTDSMAVVIAKNHIIEDAGYKTIEINNGSFPKSTMNNRFTSVEWITDNATGRNYALLNNNARIIESDLEKENGFVQVIDEVLNPSSYNVYELLADQGPFTLMASAILATGLDKKLGEFDTDPEYEKQGKHLEKSDYQVSDRQRPQFPPYPAEHKQRFTLLAETDELLADPNNNHMGWSINSLDSLVLFAELFYGTEAQGDYQNPKNALYKFVAYHIIDRQLLYKSTGVGGFLMEDYKTKMGFDSEIHFPARTDRYDYFETVLPYTMVKVTKPYSNDSEYSPYGATTEKSTLRQEIVINYAQDNGTRCLNPNMQKYINVVVERPTVSKRRPYLDKFNQNALNGIIHTIDRILIYNEDEMRDNIFNERMRWDASSLFPELTNNGVRWSEADAEYTLTYIPDGFCKRLKINAPETRIYYLRTSNGDKTGYTTYMNDEILIFRQFDFEIRLPYVPEGDYEVRFGFSQSDRRGVVQMYLDKKICGIPVNMKSGAELDAAIGWVDDKEMTEEEIEEFDKAMRNRGFMKGPASIIVDKDGTSMRGTDTAIRKIVGIYRLDKGDHWLRFKNVSDINDGQVDFSQDYIEIVPTTIISNPAKPEDKN